MVARGNAGEGVGESSELSLVGGWTTFVFPRLNVQRLFFTVLGTARLVTRLIDGLRAHQQKGTEIGCYGVGRPSHPQPLGHSLGQLRIGDQFRDLRTPCPDLGLCLSTG